jgi:hypothetical protein
MHTKSALASLLLVSAVNGHAQTLGAAQGAVIIGRPLDIVVQSPGLASDDATALCVQAEVRYGETRLGPSDVSVRLEPQVGQRDGAIRVQARPAVNEPFVTVEVRIGCPSRFVRAYTMLADVESPAPPPVVVAPVGAPAVRPAATVSAPAPRSSSLPAGPSAIEETPIRSLAPVARPPGVARLASKARPIAAAEPRAGEEARGTVRAMPAGVQAPKGPRLELEPVDIGQGTPKGASDGAPTPTGPVSAEAPPTAQAPGGSDAMPAAVEQELAALRAEQQRLLAAIESLNRELTDARQSRNDGWLYALAGLALALAGVLLWLLRQRPSGVAPATAGGSVPWWTIPAGRQDEPAGALASKVARAESDAGTAGSDVPAPVSTGLASVPAAGSAAAEHLAGLEVNEAGASVLLETPIAILDMAALHDLWERADFFESLGQAGDAIAALSAFVRAHPRASEAPYLRWWTLARRHGLDSRTLQTLYEQHYHRLLVVDDADAGLEADAALMQALTATWPGEQARAIVVAALASQPGDPGSPLHVRTLAAFDDLITLHGVLDLLPVLGPMPEATAMKAGGDAVPGVAAAASAALAPAAAGLDLELPDIAEVVPPSEAVGDTTSATPGADEGLDFDLSGWEPSAESKAPPRG